MEGTSSGPDPTLSTAELAASITELTGHLNAANRRWLALIAEFDRRKGWSDERSPARTGSTGNAASISARRVRRSGSRTRSRYCRSSARPWPAAS